MKTSGGAECVKKIWRAGKGLTGFTHLNTPADWLTRSPNYDSSL